ncbi:MAG: hypothetical protein ACI9SQ_000178 [Rubritalea sp.]|jgi:hypothetical protein
MHFSDYIDGQKTTKSKWFRIRMRYFITALVLISTTLIMSFIFRVELLKTGSSMLSNIEANQAAEDLSRKAQLIEIEAESKVAYNTDVVWVEISRDQQPIFSKICLGYVSWDTPLSFIGTPNGNIKACVPVNHREQILNKMKQIEEKIKSAK